MIGDDKSPHAEDDEEHKAEPLLQWSTSRENELPLKVDPSNCKHCTPSYCLLPKNVNSYKRTSFPCKSLASVLTFSFLISVCDSPVKLPN